MKQTILCIVLFFSTVCSQLKTSDIILNDSTTIASAELRFIKGDTVIFVNRQNVFVFHIDSLSVIVERIVDRSTGTGALIGALIAAPAGVIIGNTKDKEPDGSSYFNPGEESGVSNKIQYGVIGLGAGAIIGGIVGNSFNTVMERRYDISDWTTPDRIAFIKKHFSYMDTGNSGNRDETIVYPAATSTIKDSLLNTQRTTTSSLSLTMTIGAGFPVGNFGTVNRENSSGMAQTGFYGSLFANIANSSRVTFQVGVSYSSHTIDGRPFLAIAPNVTAGKWTLVTPMAGIRFLINPKSRSGLFTLFRLGLMFGTSPEVKMQSGNLIAKQTGASGNGVAIQFGTGFSAGDVFDIGISYVYGNPKYDVTVISGSSLYSQSVSQSTSIVVTTFGIRL